VISCVLSLSLHLSQEAGFRQACLMFARCLLDRVNGVLLHSLISYSLCLSLVREGALNFSRSTARDILICNLYTVAGSLSYRRSVSISLIFLSNIVNIQYRIMTGGSKCLT